MDFINHSIFVVNQIAVEYTEQHIQLWEQFEKTVPAVERNAYFGADSVLYLDFLRKNYSELLAAFDENIAGIVVK